MIPKIMAGAKSPLYILINNESGKGYTSEGYIRRIIISDPYNVINLSTYM